MYLIHLMLKNRVVSGGALRRTGLVLNLGIVGSFTLVFSRRFFLVLLLSAAPLSALSQIDAPAVIVTPQSKVAAFALQDLSYTCVHKQQVRKLFVNFPSGTPLPCTLDYHKVTESTEGRKTIWRARKDPQFCENKMIQMVEQFEEWGWDCTEP